MPHPVKPANSGKVAAVIGYGRMGRIHARVLDEFGHDVVTVDPVAPDADVASVAELDGPVDAVAVAAPIPLLHGLSMDALEHLRPARMLVEKPGAMSPVDMQVMAARAAAHGTRVAIGYTERHNPAIIALREHLATGQRAPITHIAAARYSPAMPSAPGVPVAVDVAVHDIDLARRLAPGRPFGWRGGYAPHHMRAVMCHHADGRVSALDLRAHMLDGEVVEGAEPVWAEWWELLAADAQPVSLRHETMVLATALALHREGKA